jgi:hypothetical protein
MAIVPVTAMPYAAASPDAERNWRTTAIVLAIRSQFISGM